MLLFTSSSHLFLGLPSDLVCAGDYTFTDSQLNKFFCFVSTIVLSTTPRITPIASAQQYTSVPVQVETHKLLVTNLQIQHWCQVCVGYVHSVQQKSIGLIFRTPRSGNDVRYSCNHISSRFTFPIFVHSWRFSVFNSLQSITPRIY